MQSLVTRPTNSWPRALREMSPQGAGRGGGVPNFNSRVRGMASNRARGQGRVVGLGHAIPRSFISPEPFIDYAYHLLYSTYVDPLRAIA